VIGPSTDHIDGVRPKPNGIGTNDSGISKCTTRDVLRIPLALKITTNESGWSWITGIGANDASVDVGNGSHLLNNPMKAALEQLHGNLNVYIGSDTQKVLMLLYHVKLYLSYYE